jgi:hypothetical protein
MIPAPQPLAMDKHHLRQLADHATTGNAFTEEHIDLLRQAFNADTSGRARMALLITLTEIRDMATTQVRQTLARLYKESWARSRELHNWQSRYAELSEVVLAQVTD